MVTSIPRLNTATVPDATLLATKLTVCVFCPVGPDVMVPLLTDTFNAAMKAGPDTVVAWIVTVTNLEVLQGFPAPVQVIVYCGGVTDEFGILTEVPVSVTTPVAAATRNVDVAVDTTFPRLGVFATPGVGLMLMTPALDAPNIMLQATANAPNVLTIAIGD
jgi:hypothetical protein